MREINCSNIVANYYLALGINDQDVFIIFGGYLITRITMIFITSLNECISMQDITSSIVNKCWIALLSFNTEPLHP